MHTAYVVASLALLAPPTVAAVLGARRGGLLPALAYAWFGLVASTALATIGGSFLEAETWREGVGAIGEMLSPTNAKWYFTMILMLVPGIGLLELEGRQARKRQARAATRRDGPEEPRA